MEAPAEYFARTMNATSGGWDPMTLFVITGLYDPVRMDEIRVMMSYRTRPTRHGTTALFFAAINEDISFLSYLLRSREYAVDHTNQYGETALHWAAHKGFLAHCLMLIEAGCPIHDRDGDGFTAFQWAESEGYCFEELRIPQRREHGKRLFPRLF